MDLALIAPNHVESGTGRLLHLETATVQGAISGKYLVRTGDVVYSKIRPALRKVCVAPVDCLCSADMYPLRTAPTLSNRFLLYWMLSEPFSALAVLESQRVAMPKINRDSLKPIPIPLPPRAEQEAIADFLDRETEQIDSLIARQERLIDVLAEKRQVVTLDAVTKGLDTSVPLKDSGIGWIGGIPRHWRSGPVRRYARLESGHTPSRQHPEYWENCTIPWISLADVWQIRDGDVDYITETAELISTLGVANSAARVLPRGTVVLSRTASVGFSAIMGADMATTQDFANWVCGPSIRPEFLLFCFRAMKQEFERLKTGSTHQTIYMPDIASLACPVPPLDEQDAIVEHIRQETLLLSGLVSKAIRSIEVLQERRTALISAAVTGKIDVRNPVEHVA